MVLLAYGLNKMGIPRVISWPQFKQNAKARGDVK